jgi:hypothetical protein
MVTLYRVTMMSGGNMANPMVTQRQSVTMPPISSRVTNRKETA